jgi:hypothetical protein
MIYVIDNDSLRVLSHYYPKTFESLWNNIGDLIARGEFLSVKEVHNEIESKLPNLGFMDGWIKTNKHIFLPPSMNEMLCVTEIYKIRKFREAVKTDSNGRAIPHADALLVASAKIRGGTVVTQERWKEHSDKIPNVCEHFEVPCINVEKFLEDNSWVF